jgi:hypothetical protein
MLRDESGVRPESIDITLVKRRMRVCYRVERCNYRLDAPLPTAIVVSECNSMVGFETWAGSKEPGSENAVSNRHESIPDLMPRHHNSDGYHVVQGRLKDHIIYAALIDQSVA